MYWPNELNIAMCTFFLPPVFSLPEFCKIFNIKSTSANLQKVKTILLSKNLATPASMCYSDGIIITEKNNTTERWMTKEKCLTGQTFAIKPSKYEYNNNVIIAGNRFSWLLDIDHIYTPITLKYKRHALKKRSIMMPYSLAEPYSYLCNEHLFTNELLNKDRKNLDIFPLFGPEQNVWVEAFECADMYGRLSHFSQGDCIEMKISFDPLPTCSIKSTVEFDTMPSDELQKEFDERMTAICLFLGNKALPTNCVFQFFSLSYSLLFSYSPIVLEELVQNSKHISLQNYGYTALLWPDNIPLPPTHEWSFDCLFYNDQHDKLFIDTMHIPLTTMILSTVITKYFFDEFTPIETEDTRGTVKDTITAAVLNIFDESEEARPHEYKLVQIIDGYIELLYAQINPYNRREPIMNLRKLIVNLYSTIVSFVLKLKKNKLTPSSFENQSGLMLNQLLEQTMVDVHYFNTIATYNNEDIEIMSETLCDLQDMANELIDDIKLQLNIMQISLQ